MSPKIQNAVRGSPAKMITERSTLSAPLTPRNIRPGWPLARTAIAMRIDPDSRKAAHTNTVRVRRPASGNTMRIAPAARASSPDTPDTIRVFLPHGLIVAA